MTASTITKTAVGTKFQYCIDGEVSIAASKVDYSFASVTSITNGETGDSCEIVSYHKSRAAASKGATTNIWAARMGTVAGRNTKSFRGNGPRPAPIISIRVIEL